MLFLGKFFENLLFGGLFISIFIICLMEIEKIENDYILKLCFYVFKIDYCVRNINIYSKVFFL